MNTDIAEAASVKRSHKPDAWADALTAKQHRLIYAAKQEDFSVAQVVTSYKDQYPSFNPNKNLEEAAQWLEKAALAYKDGSSFEEVCQMIAYSNRINVDRREMSKYLKKHGGIIPRAGSFGKGLPCILIYSEDEEDFQEMKQLFLDKGMSEKKADKKARLIVGSSSTVDVKVHSDDPIFSNPKVLAAFCEAYNRYHVLGNEATGDNFEDLMVEVLNEAGIPAEKTKKNTRGADVRMLLNGREVVLELKTLAGRDQRSGAKVAIETLHDNPLGVPQNPDELREVLRNLKEQLNRSDRQIVQQLDREGINPRTGQPCYRYNLMEIPVKEITASLDEYIGLDDETMEELFFDDSFLKTDASLTLWGWTDWDSERGDLIPSYNVHIGRDAVSLTAIQPHFRKPLATFCTEPC